jgi:uncharacterized protein YfaS (alpha-2-macroglobulin family)
MKKIINLFIMSMVFTVSGIAQNRVAESMVTNKYVKEWAEIRKLQEQGLPQSILPKVEVLYKSALKEKNYEQVIKAVIFQLNCIGILDDNDVAANKIFNTLKSDSETLPQPAKSIIYSIIGQMYEEYYNQNRWRINQRTYIPADPDDVKTLDTRKLTEKAVMYYELSLREAEILQNTPMDQYREILESAYNVKLQPVVYDLLAERALACYASIFNTNSLPRQAFVVNDVKYFANVKDFVEIDVQTPDTLSPQYLSLRIYQKLLRFYLNRPEYAEALVNKDLKRVEFLKNKGKYPNKNKLYEDALHQMSKDYEQYQCNAQVLLKIAANCYEKGLSWRDSKESELKSGYEKANEICQIIRKKYPEQCKNEVELLLEGIHNKELNIKFEKVQLPEEPFLALVKFRNMDTLYQTIYKLTENQAIDLIYHAGRYKKDTTRYEIADFMKSITVKPMKGIINLPAQAGFQYCTTEIKINPLEKGLYLIYLSDSINPLKSNVYAYSLLQVSQLAARERMIADILTVSVTDRISGEPLKGAAVTYYDDLKERDSFLSDENGIAKSNTLERQYSNNRHYKIEHKAKQLLVFGDLYSRSIYQHDKNLKTILFTDRAIYRPGQTVFYKAILYDDSEKNEKKLLQNHSATVRFYDVNRQVIREQALKSNDFGSLDGNFVIPKGLLNGRFTIECENGSIAIQVEEYKRPAFAVKFDTIRENYKPDDTLKVAANVEALAGYAIGGADVRYSVMRSTRYKQFRHWYPPRYDMQEIASGMVKTDESGKAIIEFQAFADAMENDELIYTYTVTADVTDINGETQTGTIDVAVSRNPLLIRADIPQKINIEQLNDFTVETTNPNGHATPSTIEVKMVELKSPDKMLRKRIWDDIIDIPSISEKEFRRDFPLDEYNHEQDPDHFAEKGTIAQFVIDTEKTKKLDLTALQNSGYYKLMLKARNRQGITVNDTVIFNFTGRKPEKITSMDHWLTAVKTTAEPGENIEFLLAGGNDNSYVYYEIFHENKLIESKWMKAGTMPAKLFLPAKEAYRGGFIINFSMVQNNRIYSATEKITIPFTNKMLDVKLATFRDKLLPGENEKWTMLVSNKNGEKEVAEIVASLYDASLDAFVPHAWADINSIYNSAAFYAYSWMHNAWQISNFNICRNDNPAHRPNSDPAAPARINWFEGTYRQAFSAYGTTSVRSALAGRAGKNEKAAAFEAMDETRGILIAEKTVADVASGAPKKAGDAELPKHNDINARSNFSETAFFYPQLRTGKNGEVLIEFTMPEALTRWKLLSFAHTKELKAGTYTSELITRKQVAISANLPRFFRESDEVELTAKVNNLTRSSLDGQALLSLYDAVTMQPVDHLTVSDRTFSFTVKPGQSAAISWKLKIPEGIQAITCRMTAQAGTHSDGEERTVPVLPRAMLMTETMPFSVRAGQAKSFTMDRLLKNKSRTLRNHSLTLEYTSAPAWYAVQALPCIMEYSEACAEQTFSRYYANTLATAIVNKMPRIKQIFDAWSMLGSDALTSNLEKNQELKQVMLEETPWAVQAKSETESKKRIGLLFDLNHMSSELNQAFNKLEKMQNEDGGFPWFEGNPSSRNITQHIIAGMAHLEKIPVVQRPNIPNISDMHDMAARGLAYLDREIWKDYDALIKSRADLKKKHVNASQVNYLYACSFDRHLPASEKNREAFDYYLSQTEQFWLELSTCEKAMAALALYRFDKQDAARKIIASLKQYAQQSEEAGMYWKDNVAGYYWHQAPVETQALLMEAFHEIAGDANAVEEMKIWLLRNRQANRWKTTKATSEAIYALLMTDDRLLDESGLPEMKIAGKPLEKMTAEPMQPEPGTGYVKTSWQGKEITSSMAKITVKNPNHKGFLWGGMYWQYFEQADKITSSATSLKMTKQLFLRILTDKGEELRPLDSSIRLHPGDLVRVRIELRADRDFEYVHIKDMRAAGLEPAGTLSGHRYQDGLFYYQSIKDASSNYFIAYLPKGTCVFEYDLRASHKGDFAGGITTFQCMYAPEFSAHSEGFRINIE